MPGRLAGLEGLDWQELPRFRQTHPRPQRRPRRPARRSLARRRARSRAMSSCSRSAPASAERILSDGQLLRGHLGRAGHFGHISIHADGPPDIVNTPGSLEDAVGNHSLPRPQRRTVPLHRRSRRRRRKPAMPSRRSSGKHHPRPRRRHRFTHQCLRSRSSSCSAAASRSGRRSLHPAAARDGARRMAARRPPRSHRPRRPSANGPEPIGAAVPRPSTST